MDESNLVRPARSSRPRRSGSIRLPGIGVKPAFIFFFAILSLIGLAVAGNAVASPAPFAPTPQPTPTRTTGHIATTAELQKAVVEWTASAHANTFDSGMGANTTCARCKSPRNWDALAPSAEQALDCGACKHKPGSPRPDLAGGVPVQQTDWKNIGCATCHKPVGDSYDTAISYWNNSTHAYEPVADSTALCAHCHEGQHGFQVIEEQAASTAHKGWACVTCHGPHGAVASCKNCHDPTTGRGAAEHARHPNVDCTACHDAGGLNVMLQTDPSSRLAAQHVGTYITVRFAHTLTSWPSHDIQEKVDCRRCHHPAAQTGAVVAAHVQCAACHPEGAVLKWCPIFPRDSAPDVKP